jgi:transcriptional regulator with XRE-family HTH domain
MSETQSQRNYLSINLKWLLNEHSLTMAELARRCNLAGPVLFRVVTGIIRNPQIHTLLPIANYFNCSLENLANIELSKNPEKLNLKKEMTEIRHQMRNAIAVINNTLKGTQKVLPTLLECYYLLPEELRPQILSSEALRLLPQILESGIKTVTDLKDEVNQLKEKTDAA